jgi:hypothetical protein
MLKPVIALSSIVIGVAALGFALTKPDWGHYFVNGKSPAAAHREIAAARPMEFLPVSVRTPVTSLAEAPRQLDVMTLDAVTIRGTWDRPRAVVRSPVPPRTASKELNPCSEWRELGPNSGVRMLCAGSGK